MTDENKNTGHNYDGIEELDNNLPKWWLAILYFTMAFSAVYFFYYHIGEGPTLNEEYQKEHVLFENAALQRAGSGNAPSESDLLAIYNDPARRKQGEAVYQSKCVSCHGPQGQGGIGPNLTDAYWLHGANLTDIEKSISVGVPDKGMPPWGAILSADELHSVVAFVHAFKGTNPPGAKAPQGVLVK